MMHYFKFNIGDYASHTKGLSLMEDLAYRRMIDEYYLSEHPFNMCSTDVARRIGMRDQVEEVDYILSAFFEKDGDSYRHSRIDIEIIEYKDGKEKKSRAGRASAEKRKSASSVDKINTCSTPVQQTLDDSSTDVQLNSNHKPLTTNQEPVKKSSRFTPPSQNEVIGYMMERNLANAHLEAEKFIDFYESKGWMVGKTKMKSWQATVRNWTRRAKENAGNNNTAKTGNSNLHAGDLSWSTIDSTTGGGGSVQSDWSNHPSLEAGNENAGRIERVETSMDDGIERITDNKHGTDQPWFDQDAGEG